MNEAQEEPEQIFHTSAHHPLSQEVVKNMRQFAERDQYHGAEWETIVTLCDEVEFLQRKLGIH